MINIIEPVSTEIRQRLESVRRLTDLLPNFTRLEQLLRRTPAGFVPRPLLMGEQLLLCVTVASVRDILPFLEFLEAGLDIDFDKSQDIASSRYRYFTAASAPWLRVDAEFPEDGPGCRRVITGYKQEPIYEIQCLETVDAPAQIAGPAPAVLSAPVEELDAISP